MYGIIYNDELKYNHFNNYKLALFNFFGKSRFKKVNNVGDLDGITHLFIIDEHYSKNVDIWSQQNFIDRLNKLNIRTIIFNTERIEVKEFPWNRIIQQKVLSINNCYQILTDTEEAQHYNKKFINMFLLSKSVNYDIKPLPEKENKLLFIGNYTGEQYKTRYELIQTIKSNDIGIPFDVISTKNSNGVFMPYEEYLNTINKYKYLLCPLGTGKFIAYRHFEAVRLGCIPLQEMTNQMIPWYKDIEHNCKFFTSPEQINTDLLSNPIEQKEIYLEDYLEKINIISCL